MSEEGKKSVTIKRIAREFCNKDIASLCDIEEGASYSTNSINKIYIKKSLHQHFHKVFSSIQSNKSL